MPSEFPVYPLSINWLLSLLCLALFVSFINNVSQQIQIGNIINHVYRNTMRSLKYQIEKETTCLPVRFPTPRTGPWCTVRYQATSTQISRSVFLRVARRLDIIVKMCVLVGQFINRRDRAFFGKSYA